MKLLYQSKLLLISIFTFICLSACSNLSQNNARAETIIQDRTTYDQQAKLYEQIILARIAAGQYNYQKALEYYLSALSIRPDSELAKEALELNEQLSDPAMALLIAEQWVKIQPEAIAPWKTIAFYSFLTNDGDRTEQALGKIIALEVEPTELVYIIESVLSRGDKTKAVKLFQTLAKNHPSNQSIAIAMAIVYQKYKEWSKAIALTSKVMRYEQSLPLAWKLHSSLLKLSGAKNESIDWYKKALIKFPDSNVIRHNLGQTFYNLDRFSEAREQFSINVINSPNDSDSNYMLAASYYSEKNYALSRQYFEPLLRIRRHRNPVLFYLGEMAREESDLGSAIKFFKKVKPSRYYQTAHFLVARLMQQQGNEQQALVYLQNLSINAKDTNFRYMRSLLAAELGDLTLAENDLRYILTIEPNNIDVINALGYTLADANKNLSEAKDLIDVAYKSQPNSPAIVDSMGWVLYRLGRYPESLEYLEKAYKLDASEEIASHLGEVLWGMDKKVRAQKILTSAIKNFPDSNAVKNTIHKLNITLDKRS